ncbi:MAG: hypothetical protein ACRC2T_03970 [Thermoguttaceae bacterium]
MTSSQKQIEQIRAQALERITEMTAVPKPSYSVDGQSVSWNDYLKQLQSTVQWCDTIINAENIPAVISKGVCDY